ncbi:MAG: hypothetical protein PHI94_04580 [Eubacteriaceae bacterium]|jgi:hypothetical protein|nr:hypothetical protein [Eubacteriaceae bacterium]MDD4508377.1 hypothetical protein [Eubacteriaceae bacterium]
MEDHTHSDYYYSTLDAVIATIKRQMPLKAMDSETLTRLLDDVLMHFKYEEMQRQKHNNEA